MNKVHYNVNGLINNVMKTEIKNVLEDLDGISKVNIDLVRSTVEVDYNPPADSKEIKHCIEQTGCKVTGTLQ
ncbi:MAG TPA: heavy-metal-associated domain-containing protein [Clostridiales bacterium]|nr:heavy-metal-associated domain-containing protein [Clostridiales bacterium]